MELRLKTINEYIRRHGLELTEKRAQALRRKGRLNNEINAILFFVTKLKTSEKKKHE